MRGFVANRRGRWTTVVSALVLGAAVLVGARRESPRSSNTIALVPPTSIDSADDRLWIEMQNVALRIDESATMGIRTLRGEVIADTPDHVAVLDDARTFHIRVTSGTVALDGAAVTALLNTRVFNYPARNLGG